MPKTTREREKSLERPSVCDLLPIRDFLDKIMVREDGTFVAGFTLGGAQTYFSDNEGRNETKRLLESLLLTLPENSIRIQFRYEIVESVGDLLDVYRDAQKTTDPRMLALDEERIRALRAANEAGQFLSRYCAAYLIWDPVKHHKLMQASGSTSTKQPSKKPREKQTFVQKLSSSIDSVMSLFAPVSQEANVRRGKQEHERVLAEFNALLSGIETSLKRAGLSPMRMTHDDLFLEIKRALNPIAPDTAPLRNTPDYSRYLSARSQLACVSFWKQRTHLNIDGILWSTVTLKLAPDATFPGITRELMTLGLPLVISTHMVVPDQTKVLEVYKSRYRKMQAALSDGKGGQRADVTAAVAAREILAVQERIIASSVKTVQFTMTVAVRTSTPAYDEHSYDEAVKQLAERTQRVVHVIGRINGARAYAENIALQDTFLDTLPGLSGDTKRDLDLLTEHAADLVPVELPWAGTPDGVAMLVKTPYRQLIPFSHFAPSIENANMILAATSGTGKGMFVGQMLLTYARQGARISILERGDSYARAVEYCGGQMLTMSLDSPHTINPFDLVGDEVEPSNDHKSFLKSLIRFMIGSSANSDTDVLDGVILVAIERAYRRAAMRVGLTNPTLRDVRAELRSFVDEDRNAIVAAEASLAATKLKPWVEGGMYAQLFDRQTTVNMDSQWLYFNTEKLQDDKKLETAMSLLIAYATTRRAQGTGSSVSITVIDEGWSIMENASLADTVTAMYRTSRKRRACIWGISQAITDFTGTPDAPLPSGDAILMSTATKMVGRQKGNMAVLKDILHASEPTINYVKNIGMTEKGKRSTFVCMQGETTFAIDVEVLPFEYWLLTTFPREKDFIAYWLRTHDNLPLEEAYQMIAALYPQGLSSLPPLPEELSGEVYGVAHEAVLV